MTKSTRDNLRRSAWLGVPVVGALLTALFLALPTGAVEQSSVYDILGVAVVGASLLGVWLHRPAGWQPWVILALGQLSFVVGDIIWTAYAALGVDPFPSLADIAYLLGYPMLALGLGLAIRRRVSGGDRAGLLDGAILATGAVVVWWAFVLGPVVAATDPEPLGFAISVAYPIGDLLLIGMALGLIMTPGARSASFRFLIASLVVLLVGDLVYGLQSLDGTYIDGGLLDGMWLIAYVLFGTAAMHPTMTAVFEPKPVAVALLGPVRLALLGGAMLVGPALLVLDHAGADSVVLVVGAATAILSVLVLIRLSGIVRILARDIERRTVLEAQLSFQAFHDPLTGLANRRRFITEVADSIASGTGTGVLFVDLDDFKHVNDEMGHDAGDALLSAVGNRLVRAIRPDDIGCRIGGDEFAVLLLETSELDEAETVGRRLLEALGAPITLEGRDLVVPASIGVAVAQLGETIEVDELLRRADVAMYHAKAQGKNRLACYTALLEPAVRAVPDAGPSESGLVEPLTRRPRQPRPAPST